jgi:DNA transposition AAA+ family ATPase
MPAREDAVPLDVLRDAVRLRAADTSVTATAREVGISHQALARFLEGAEPYSRNVAKLRQWYRRETNELIRCQQEVERLKRQVAELKRQLRERKG